MADIGHLPRGFMKLCEIVCDWRAPYVTNLAVMMSGVFVSAQAADPFSPTFDPPPTHLMSDTRAGVGSVGVMTTPRLAGMLVHPIGDLCPVCA